MRFRRVVDVVEYIALGCAVVAVGLLLFYRPSPSPAPRPAAASSAGTGAPSGTGTPSTPQAASGANGKSVYINNCATCHGSQGEGGIGPRLGKGAVASRFPNATDEILLVTSGRDGMPAWGGRLSADEIKAVVEYTRTGL